MFAVPAIDSLLDLKAAQEVTPPQPGWLTANDDKLDQDMEACT
jgi:hypothetical protein